MAARRVLFLHSSAGRYGADRQLWLLATTLDRERYHPLVVLPFEGPLTGDLRTAGVEVLSGPMAVLRREHMTPLGLSRLARELAYQRPALERLVRAQRVDVVHANTSVILGARDGAHAGGARYAVHVREIYPQRPVMWPWHRRQIRAADAVLCVSEATRAPLFESDDHHVHVVPDGLAVVHQPASRATARLALGLPQHTFVVAVLGRISGWKGQSVLARALDEEALRMRGAIGLVAGDVWPGQERWEQELRAAGEPAGDRLRLLGFRDDLETIYGAADVIVVPSTQPDPLPNSALEAAAAGCCVVASAAGGLAEIIRDGQTGVLVPPGDHAALARALAALADDPARRAALGAAAAEDVRARYAADRLAPRVMAIYDEMLRTAGR